MNPKRLTHLSNSKLVPFSLLYASILSCGLFGIGVDVINSYSIGGNPWLRREPFGWILCTLPIIEFSSITFYTSIFLLAFLSAILWFKLILLFNSRLSVELSILFMTATLFSPTFLLIQLNAIRFGFAFIPILAYFYLKLTARSLGLLPTSTLVAITVSIHFAVAILFVIYLVFSWTYARSRLLSLIPLLPSFALFRFLSLIYKDSTYVPGSQDFRYYVILLVAGVFLLFLLSRGTIRFSFLPESLLPVCITMSLISTSPFQLMFERTFYAITPLFLFWLISRVTRHALPFFVPSLAFLSLSVSFIFLPYVL